MIHSRRAESTEPNLVPWCLGAEQELLRCRTFTGFAGVESEEGVNSEHGFSDVEEGILWGVSAF